MWLILADLSIRVFFFFVNLVKFLVNYLILEREELCYVWVQGDTCHAYLIVIELYNLSRV